MSDFEQRARAFLSELKALEEKHGVYILSDSYTDQLAIADSLGSELLQVPEME